MIKFSSSNRPHTDRQGREPQIREPAGRICTWGQGVSATRLGGQEEGCKESTLIHPSGVKLRGLTLTLEACPLGSKMAEGPLAQPSIPSSQKEPGCPLKSKSLRCWEKRTRRLFRIHKAKAINGFGAVGLAILLPNEQVFEISADFQHKTDQQLLNHGSEWQSA